MAIRREDGAVHPGFRWGPFTFRVPFYHTRFEGPEFFQGILVSAATGLAIVPVMTGSLGLTFEEAVSMALLHAILVSSAPILFGEPFAAGWITPALPLVLTFVTAGVYEDPSERLQMMTALSLNFALLLFVLGATGLGKRLIEWLPAALKGAIIMGAAIAALSRVFVNDPTVSGNVYQMPIAMTLAIGICLLMTFSKPLQAFKGRHKWFEWIASLGLLPGFVVAGVVGALPFVGEIEYNIQWGDNYGILIPHFPELFAKVTPFAIGWPSPAMFIQAIPLAFIAYIVLFGDIITGIEVLRGSMDKRPDEKIEFNINRTHFSTCIRNALMGLFAPFFPTQGSLWTGVHVIIVNRWAEGRDKVDSLYSGISSYYFFGLPLLYLALPVVTGLQPLMPIALALTLVLTGFACAYVAMNLPRNQIERGVVLLGGAALAIFPAWLGLAIAIAVTFLLLGFPDGQREDT